MSESSGAIDKTKLKFVLYARKSTEDEGSQVNSIPDQISYCEAYARGKGLTIVDIIQEEASAKFSGNRPKFKQMLKDIVAGKYDAILAYHPDRLSRNMLEAGQLLDMLTPDKKGNDGPLKTLAFVTASFENDTANRLTLAVLFSLATNFSEHLSEMVKRTTDVNIKQGISVGTPKWGYDIDETTQHYKPNKDYKIVREGLLMVMNGGSQKDAIRFWKSKDLKRKTKINRKNKVERVIHIGKDTTIFRDPFAFGLLCQKDEEINLCEVYDEGFKPLLTKEEWDQLQSSLPNPSKPRNLSGKKTHNFMPFRGGFLKCGVCGKSMYISPSNGKGGTYAYAMCQNKACTRKQKNVRLKVIMNDLYKTLDKINITDELYKHYCEAFDKYADNELTQLRQERASLCGRLSQFERERTKLDRQFASVSILESAPKSTLNTLQRDIDNCNREIQEMQDRVDEIDVVLKDPAQIQLTKENFLNSMKGLGKKMRAGNLVQKDTIARYIFSNITLTDKNTLIYLCKPEFEGLIKTGKINSGATEQIFLELPEVAAVALYSHPNPSFFKLSDISAKEEQKQIALIRPGLHI